MTFCRFLSIEANLIVQIKLLKILALLGAGDRQASEHMYTVVGDLFKKYDPLSNIGNAVLYQSICCVASIFPNPKLLEAAADAISRFLKVWLYYPVYGVLC